MSKGLLRDRIEAVQRAARRINHEEEGGEQALYDLARYMNYLAAGKPKMSKKELNMHFDEGALDRQMNAEEDLRSPTDEAAKEARDLLTIAYFENDDASLGKWLREALKANSPILEEAVKLAARLADEGSTITVQGAVVKCHRTLCHEMGFVTLPHLYAAVGQMLGRDKDDTTLQSQVRRAISPEQLGLPIRRVRNKARKKRQIKKRILDN